MNIHYTTQFKKDYKRIKKQNKNLSKLKAVIEKLVEGKRSSPNTKITNYLVTGMAIATATLNRTGS